MPTLLVWSQGMTLRSMPSLATCLQSFSGSYGKFLGACWKGLIWGSIHNLQCPDMLSMVSNELRKAFIRDITSFAASLVNGVAVVGCFRANLGCWGAVSFRWQYGLVVADLSVYRALMRCFLGFASMDSIAVDDASLGTLISKIHNLLQAA